MMMQQVSRQRAASHCFRAGQVRAWSVRPVLPRQSTVVYAEQPGPSSNGAPTSTPTKEVEDLPPWVRREKERELQAQEAAKGGVKVPWPLALIGSVLVAIAATGSIFEYIDKNPIFGVLQPDNPLWAPILLFMAVTGYPTAGLLFKYGVDEFNAAAELQDRLDGYLPEDRK